MFRRTCALGIVLLLAAYILKIFIVSCMNMDLGEFKPVSAIFLLDISASNRNLLDKQEQTILKIAKRLDGEDSILIIYITGIRINLYKLRKLWKNAGLMILQHLVPLMVWL